MSDQGTFIEDDDDIVTLLANGGNSTRTGWINVGVHSLYVSLSPSGDLTIEAQPRQNEGTVLGSITVSKAKSVQSGGVDPDA